MIKAEEKIVITSPDDLIFVNDVIYRTDSHGRVKDTLKFNNNTRRYESFPTKPDTSTAPAINH